MSYHLWSSVLYPMTCPVSYKYSFSLLWPRVSSMTPCLISHDPRFIYDPVFYLWPLFVLLWPSPDPQLISYDPCFISYPYLNSYDPCFISYPYFNSYDPMFYLLTLVWSSPMTLVFSYDPVFYLLCPRVHLLGAFRSIGSNFSEPVIRWLSVLQQSFKTNFKLWRPLATDLVMVCSSATDPPISDVFQPSAILFSRSRKWPARTSH